MKINEVRLRNFRSHSDTTVNFDDGINLLLGHNGSGKSSVLEALSFALLDIPLREGGNRNKSCIKKGQACAAVEVEITGNDGNRYVVFREIRENGNPRNSLSLKGSPVFSENRMEIINKIQEILDIKENGREIFENIIVAKQNAIVDQFMKTPSERKKFFNQILNTEIYDKIAGGFCKEYISCLSKENMLLGVNIENLEKETMPLDDKTAEKKDTCEKLKSVKIAFEEITGLLSKTETELEKAHNTKNEIENKKSTVGTEQKKRYDFARLFKEVRNDLLTSSRSLEIVRRNEADYGRYLSTEKDLGGVEVTLNRLEREMEALKKISDEMEKLRNENENTEASNVQILVRKRTLEADYAGKKSEHEETALILEDGRKKWVEINSNMKILKKLASAVEEINKDIRELTDTNRTLKEIRKRDSESLMDVGPLRKKRESCISERESLGEKLEEIAQLEKSRVKLEEKLSNLEKSKERLKTGMCPILGESCRNIEMFGSIEEYFEEKKREITAGIESGNGKIALRKELEKQLELKNREINSLENEIAEDEKNRKRIEKTELDIKVNEENLHELRKRMQEIPGLESSFDLGDADSVLDDVRKRESEKNTEIQILVSQMETLKTRYESVEREMTAKKLELESSDRELNSNERKIYVNKKIISENEPEIGKLPGLQELFQKNREIRNELRSNLESLRGNYSEYMKHVENAGKYEILKDRKNELLKSISNGSEKIKSLKEEINLLEKEIEKTDFDSLKEMEKEQKSKKEELLIDRTRLENILNFLENEIKRLNASKKELADKKKALRINSKKTDLVSKIQKNLKYMGAQIAGRYREEIQKMATGNLRKITEKDEFIRWNEDYGIEIAEDEAFTVNVRDFANLSGGEQVTVALCMRSAMAVRLSGLRIAIFDEPTPNLDTERRERLAESLKPLLGELEQAIIITHERDFEEMAQKTVILENREGETRIIAEE